MNNYDQQNDDVKIRVDPSLVENKRAGFIRKVYGILSVQLVVTFLFTYCAYLSPALQKFLLTFAILCLPLFIVIIAIECAVFCYRDCARKSPRNYILLAIFTLCFAYIVATICCIYFAAFENGATLVLLALGMTAFMTFGLTLYACTTDDDFTGCGIIDINILTIKGVVLFVLGMCLFFFAVMLLFCDCKLLHIIYSVLAIMLYSFYIIFDTQIIMGGKKYELDLDDYIIGAMILYIDIIILFLELLKLLAELCGK